MTGSEDSLVCQEAYRTNVSHVVCRDHYLGRKELPDSAPALGAVSDARRHGRCEFCPLPPEREGGFPGNPDDA
jgi:hypothetical protein